MGRPEVLALRPQVAIRPLHRGAADRQGGRHPHVLLVLRAKRTDPAAFPVDELPQAVRLEFLPQAFQLSQRVGAAVPTHRGRALELILRQDDLDDGLPATHA